MSVQLGYHARFRADMALEASMRGGREPGIVVAFVTRCEDGHRTAGLSTALLDVIGERRLATDFAGRATRA